MQILAIPHLCCILQTVRPRSQCSPSMTASRSWLRTMWTQLPRTLSLPGSSIDAAKHNQQGFQFRLKVGYLARHDSSRISISFLRELRKTLRVLLQQIIQSQDPSAVLSSRLGILLLWCRPNPHSGTHKELHGPRTSLLKHELRMHAAPRC